MDFIIKSMSNHNQSQPQTTPSLPSPDDALRYSLNAYFEHTVDRVAVLLGSGQRKEYSQLASQEIFERGQFLRYIYESLMALQQLAQHSQGPNSPFKAFLTGLFFTADDLTRITRFNHVCTFENGTLPRASQHILELLYETEFYIYQILLRVVLVKVAFEEHERFEREIEELNGRCLFLEYFAQGGKSIVSKRDRVRFKHLFTEVESILGYYHCELSINRNECNSRPEANCLVFLLKQKLKTPLLKFIQKNINFRCEGEIPGLPNIKKKELDVEQKAFKQEAEFIKKEQLKSQSPSEEEKLESKSQIEESNSHSPKRHNHVSNQPYGHKQQKQIKQTNCISQIKKQSEIKQRPETKLLLSKELTQIPKSSIETQKFESPERNLGRPQVVHFQVQSSPPLRPLPNIFTAKRGQQQTLAPAPKQFPPETMQTPKKDRPMKQIFNQMPEERQSPKSSDFIESYVPEIKYDRRLHPGTPSEKPKRHSKQISLKEQMKAQPKRFIQAQFKYMPKRKVVHKREEPKFYSQPVVNTVAAPHPSYLKQEKKQESQESYLAEETPVYRNRASLQSANPL